MGEVLVRMREEEKAMMPRAEFLPVLEHYGMMPMLDRWVVSALAKHLARGSRLSCFHHEPLDPDAARRRVPRSRGGELKRRRAGRRVRLRDRGGRRTGPPGAGGGLRIGDEAIGAGALVDGFGRKAVSFTPLKVIGGALRQGDGSIVRKAHDERGGAHQAERDPAGGAGDQTQVIAECAEEQDVLLRLKALGVDFAQGFGIVQPQPIETLAK